MTSPAPVTVALQFAGIAVAIILALWSAFYVHWATSRRDLKSWERDKLLSAVNELLKLSSHRNDVLWEAFSDRVERHAETSLDPYDEEVTGVPDPSRSIRLMQAQLETIQLINDDVAAPARALVAAHRSAEDSAAYAERNDVVGSIEAATVPLAELERLHTDILHRFRRAAGIARPSPRERAAQWLSHPSPGTVPQHRRRFEIDLNERTSAGLTPARYETGPDPFITESVIAFESEDRVCVDAVVVDVIADRKTALLRVDWNSVRDDLEAAPAVEGS